MNVELLRDTEFFILNEEGEEINKWVVNAGEVFTDVEIAPADPSVGIHMATVSAHLLYSDGPGSWIYELDAYPLDLFGTQEYDQERRTVVFVPGIFKKVD